MSRIFDLAHSLTKTPIIFIDEIDSLATSREDNLHEATHRLLTTLLLKIDHSEGLVICATNREEDLDPALKSRTGVSIEFALPNLEERTQIFQYYAKHLTASETLKLSTLCE